MYEKWLNILIKSALFHDIDPNLLYTMLQCMKPKIQMYKKNEYIALEGDKFEGIGVILKGSASVSKESVSGSRMIVTMLNPSNMFGEIAAFSSHRVWPATVVALENCAVMFLPPEKIVSDCPKLCSSHKTLINNMLFILSERALLLNKKLEYFTIKSIRSKICSFLIDEYYKNGTNIFMMSMNRNELADFLNVSRPSLSREMCKMRDEGLIEFHRSSIKINNVDILRNEIK